MITIFLYNFIIIFDTSTEIIGTQIDIKIVEIGVKINHAQKLYNIIKTCIYTHII